MRKSRQVIPGWLVGTAVILMVGITLYSVVQTQTALGWRASNIESPRNLSQMFFPGVASLQHAFAGQSSEPAPAATQSNAVRVPTIVAGATPIHRDRGECTSCHTVLDKRGRPTAAIRLDSRPPHDNRGLCTNCHVLGSFAPPPTPAAAAAAAPLGTGLNATPVALAGAAPAAAVAGPAEGGWNGVEVTPITSLTAAQYNVPLGTAGLIVAEAEGPGALAGLKAGDVIAAIDGVPTPTLTEFFRASSNGLMPRASVTAYRNGQPLTLFVDAGAGTPVAAPNAGQLVAATAAAPGMVAPVAAPAAPPEGEWLGLEVAPISSLSATQYNLPVGLQGLLVVEAEAQALAIGVKAGDVLQFVNGVPTVDVATFLHVTKNGTLPQGTVALWRKGEQMVTKLGQSPPAAQAPPVAPAPGVAPVAQLSPYVAAPVQPWQVAPSAGGAIPIAHVSVYLATPWQAATNPSAAQAAQVSPYWAPSWQPLNPASYPNAVGGGNVVGGAANPGTGPGPGSTFGVGDNPLGYGIGLAGNQSSSTVAPFPKQF